MDRLGAMQTFVRVVESGSFSGAALALNLGQPAVSKTVAQLEARLGVRAAVLADMGLAIGSGWMFSPELASGAVQPVLADWLLSRLDLWAVYPELKAADFRP